MSWTMASRARSVIAKIAVVLAFIGIVAAGATAVANAQPTGPEDPQCTVEPYLARCMGGPLGMPLYPGDPQCAFEPADAACAGSHPPCANMPSVSGCVGPDAPAPGAPPPPIGPFGGMPGDPFGGGGFHPFEGGGIPGGMHDFGGIHPGMGGFHPGMGGMHAGMGGAGHH